MKKKEDYQKQFITLFIDLHKDFPAYSLGQHLATAFADYGDLWGCSDKEIVYALEKYRTTLDLDYVPVQDVDKIIADAADLANILNEEDEDEDI
jgi:hypothetical protein